VALFLFQGVVMSGPSNRIFDELGRLMSDAAGVASGLRREVDGLVKSQVERLLRDVDVVTREEFESVREMAVKAREENEALKARLAKLEGKSAPKGKPAV
jgi:BMFP domain-containing protein YqiC